MRTVRFRDILWGIAYKMGLEPSDTSNFLTNEAVAIGTYIDQWVQRTYDALDWPELVVTQQFTPVNHVVPFDNDGINDVVYQIGRVLKVYLVDPATTDSPVDTPFTMLFNGIHCGYEHGSSVWVRHIKLAPKFTAELWDVSRSYQRDEVTYSSRTGECYKSRANKNVGHDPARSFQRAPLPPGINQPPSISDSPPTVQIIQARTTGSTGITARNQIYVISFATALPPPDPADPSPLNTYYSMTVKDDNGLDIANALRLTAGSETIASIITDMVADLVADGDLSTFTITGNTTNKTITLEDASNFSIGYAQYALPPPDDNVIHALKVVQTQSYTPSSASALDSPQITRVTINAESTINTGIYILTVTGSDGVKHSVEYESELYDSGNTILQGLVLAIEASSDTFWETVTSTIDHSLSTLDLSIHDSFSTDVQINVVGDPWWELVPFPRVLAEQAMRGGYADLLKEWGQTDKGTTEEQVVPAEQSISQGKFTTTPNPPLTGQQLPLSRYRG